MTFIVVSNASQFNAVLPSVIGDWSLRTSQASFLVMIYSLLFAVSTVFFSRLSDLVGIRMLLCIGLLLGGTASFFGLISPNYGSLAAARMAQAVGAAAVASLSYVYVSGQIHTSRQSSALLQIAAAVAAAFGLGPVIGSVLAHFWGWHSIFALPCALLIAIPAVYGLFEDRTPRSPDQANVPLLGERKRRCFFASRVTMQFFVSFVQMSGLFLLPIELGIAFDYAPLTIGLLLCPGAVFSSWFVLRLRKTKRRASSRQLIVYGMPAMMAGGIFLSFGTYSPWLAAVVGYLLLTTGVALASAGLNEQVADTLNDSNRGRGIGWSQLAQFVGGATGVTACGAALDGMQLPGESAYVLLFLFLSGLTAIHWLAYLTIERRGANSA